MPFYTYQYDGTAGDGCDHCRQGFDVLQKISDPRLDVCPQCGSRVHKVITAPNVAIGQAHLLKPDNIESKGFTQYRKVGKGVYEKTAGKGPNYISDD